MTIDTLKEREQQFEAEALRINAGRKPKFGDLMRNPWAGESNPHRDGYFVRAKRVTSRFNPGTWYEMTDGKGDFWETHGKFAMFIEGRATIPPATPDASAVDLQARIEHLENEEELSNAVIGRLSRILAAIAITIKGEEEVLHRHSYHDLAEMVAVLQLEVELYRDQAEQKSTAGVVEGQAKAATGAEWVKS